jgi:ankyrin repeat protein
VASALAANPVGNNSIAAQKTSSGLSRDEALAELRARGVEFNVPSFLRSVDQENPALVNLFLVAGVDPNSNEIGGSTALMIAAGLHRTDGCIDRIIRPWYSIAKKTHKSDLDTVRLLIKGGAVVQTRDGDGETALHKTAAGRNVDIAKILIAHGADVNSRNAHGTTPMMLAALTDEGTSMAELLFANGATITDKETHSSSALLNAAAGGHIGPLRFLISKGADVRSRNSAGTTALMEAASGGHGEIIDFLLDRGVELDTQDAQDNSALMYAAFKDRANCIELLLKRSANKALTNRAGETASEIATKRKFGRIVKLLE